MHSTLNSLIAATRETEIRAHQRSLARNGRRALRSDRLVLRRADVTDGAAVARIAQLDGGKAPDSPALLAEVDGERSPSHRSTAARRSPTPSARRPTSSRCSSGAPGSCGTQHEGSGRARLGAATRPRGWPWAQRRYFCCGNARQQHQADRAPRGASPSSRARSRAPSRLPVDRIRLGRLGDRQDASADRAQPPRE